MGPWNSIPCCTPLRHRLGRNRIPGVVMVEYKVNAVPGRVILPLKHAPDFN